MLSCFLCEKTGIVKEFTSETLLKCRKILAFRRKWGLHYREIILPANLEQKGYHIPCYNKFIMLKKIYRKEFDSMFSNGQVTPNGILQLSSNQLGDLLMPKNHEPPIDDIPPLEVAPKKALNKNKPSTSNMQNCIEIEVPKLEEISVIESKIDPLNTCDIELEIPETPYMMHQMDEPSYVNPDISKGVILKSILTRKTPVRKDMTKDSMAFNSGMNLLKHGTIFNQVTLNQPNLNSVKGKLKPKTVKTVSLTADDVCLLCDKEQRKIGTQVELPEVMSKVNMYKKVITYAEAMEDYELLEKLKFKKTFAVHPLCRVEYRNKHQKITRKNCDDEDWLVFKNLQTEAFERLCAFIDDKIINKNKTYFLSDLFERYKALLCEIQNTAHPFDIEKYCVQNLQENIVNRYYGMIEVTTCKLLNRKVVYKSDGETNFDSTVFDSAAVENEDFKYDKLAFELRNVVKSMKRTSDTASDNEIPEKLMRFVGSLILGPDARKTNSYEGNVKIKSMCEDIVARINMDD